MKNRRGVEFELLPAEMGIPVVRYDLADYEADEHGITAAEQREHH